MTPADAAFKPGDQGQIYANQDPPAGRRDALPAYIEMEWTSPTTTLKQGDFSSMTLTWSLHKLPEDQRSAEAVAGFLKKL